MRSYLKVMFGGLLACFTAITVAKGELLWYSAMNGDAVRTAGSHAVQATTVGTPVATTNRHGNANSAVYFNGASCFIIPRQNVPLSSASVSLWVTYADPTGANDRGPVGMGGSNQAEYFTINKTSGSASAPAFRSDFHINTIRHQIVSQTLTPGTWHHLVITFKVDGMNTTHRFYKDGVPISGSHPVNMKLNPGADWVIGAERTNNSRYWTGAIDDVAFWSEALSEADVLALYNGTKSPADIDNPVNIHPVANAGLDRVLVLPENSVTLLGSGSDADGEIVSYAWTQHSGPSAATLSGVNSPTLTATHLECGQYEFVLLVTDDGGDRHGDLVRVTVVEPPRLVWYSKMNGNANVEAPYGSNPVQTIGSPTATADRFGTPSSAVLFGGADVYLLDKQTRALSEGTIVCWARLDDKARSECAVVSVGGRAAGATSFFSLQSNGGNADGRTDMRIDLNDGLLRRGRTLQNIQADTWYHVAGVFKADELQNKTMIAVYVNGVKSEQTFDGVISAIEPTNLWVVGGYETGSKYWRGALDDVAIWNVALTDDEIGDLFSGARTPPQILGPLFPPVTLISIR